MTPLVPGSPVARATYRLMRGDRAVGLPYVEGLNPREQFVHVLDQLLARRPVAHMAFPVQDRLKALLLSGFLEQWLEELGHRVDRYADIAEVDLAVNYTDGQPGYFQSPVRVGFCYGARWARMQSLHLVVLDTATTDWQDMAWRRGAGYRAQLLLLGSRQVPEPSLPFTPTDRKRPWGEPPLELVIAGGPS